MANVFDQFDTASAPPKPANPFDQFDATPQAPVSVAEDVAKSAVSAIPKGAYGFYGGPGDLSDLVGNGIEYLSSRALKALGADVKPRDWATIVAENKMLSEGSRALPRSEQITHAVEDAAGGKFYQPQTTAGKYTDQAVQFGTQGAMGGGLFGLGRGVAAGLGSEAAGQATEGTAYEPYARIAGALAGSAAPSVAQKVITPFPISAERQALADTLAKEGVNLTAGQVTGSKGLRYAEDSIGATAAHHVMDEQKQQFTQAALKRAGIDAETATPHVLMDRKAQFGPEYDAITSRNTIKLDPQFDSDVANAVLNYGQRISGPAQAVPLVKKYVEDFTRLGGSSMPGEQYQAIRSGLRQDIESLPINSHERNALTELRNSMDGAMQRSLSPEDYQAWKNTDRQYKNYKTIADAMATTTEGANNGYIAPERLANAIMKRNREGYALGQGDLTELARAGNALMKPLPNSGTAQRMHTISAMGSAAGALGGALLGSPKEALLASMAGAAGPTIASRALMSKPIQAYLMNQALTTAADPRKQALISAMMGQKAIDQSFNPSR